MNSSLTKNFGASHDDNLLRRAVAANFRRMTGSHQVAVQPSNDSAVETVGNRRYVVLRNVSGMIAVYRVRNNDEVLKRLKRWPKQFKKNVEWRIN